MHFKMKPVALMVSALLVSPLAMAGGDDDHHGGHNGGVPVDEDYSVSVNNEIDVKLKKDVAVKKRVDINGEINFYGNSQVNANAMAIVDDKQINTNNGVLNQHHDNAADVGDSSLKDASGNIGVNISAGDNNMQDNAAAIAKTDASFVFGSADAEIFVTQGAAGNVTVNWGNVNSASISGDALRNASGNLGVNVTSGNSNLQKNNMAVSVSTSRMSEASVANMQRSDGNIALNAGRLDVYEDTTDVTMTGNLNGTYEGTSDQIGDVYLDTWAVDSDGGYLHPTDGGTTGHVDVDSAAQGAQDLNDDGGAFAFSEEGTQGLSGTFSGSVTTTRLVYTPTSNDASLSGNALANASGNIGVNVSSGTGNMQNNSLAIATSIAPAGGPGPITE